MIDSREQLIHLLTEAAEIEHGLLCSYLYAAFSLKRAVEPGLTDRQEEAVERWRKQIVKVALEEMAHLACVNNLLVAVGGAPHFDRPNLPVAPGYHPSGIVVRLTPFDAATLDHFIFLERADPEAVEDAPAFETVGTERTAHRGRLTPSSLDYKTVGELYGALAEGFRTLSARLGEGVLIDPDPSRQVDAEIAKLPDVHAVTDLASVLAVIAQIREQGEGGGEHPDSHFARFQAIKAEWAEMSAADPAFQPAWPAAHDPVMRKPAEGAERVWVTEAEAAACVDLGNAIYGAMLSLMTQAFVERDRAGKARLLAAGVELMEASAQAANRLARLPAGPDHPGVNAGLSFAVPRNLGARPEGARERFLERVGELSAAAERVLSGETRTKALRRLNRATDILEGREPRD